MNNTSFAQVKAHRFRTHLSTIVSSVELLQHYGMDLPAEERDSLIAEIGMAAQLMREMLDEAALAPPLGTPTRAPAANEPCHG